MTSQIVEHLIAEHAPDAAGRRPAPRVAVQLDGSEDRWIADELVAAGFDVVPVPDLPLDACRSTRARPAAWPRPSPTPSIDAVTFTAGPALANFVALAEEHGLPRRRAGVVQRRARRRGVRRPGVRGEGPPARHHPHHRADPPPPRRHGPGVRLGLQRPRPVVQPRRATSSCVQGRLVLIDDGEPDRAVRPRARRARGARRSGPARCTPRRRCSSRCGAAASPTSTSSRSPSAACASASARPGAGVETVVRRGYRLAAD